MIRTLAEIPWRHARERGGKTAIAVDAGEPLTYGELDDRSRRFAAFLKSRGTAAGDRVAILLRNVPEFVVAWFGAIAAGAIAVPVNVRLSPPEIAYILADCGASTVVTTRAHHGMASLAGTSGVSSWVLADGEDPGAYSFREALDREPYPAPERVSPHDVAVLIYTSGTTGFPKGAMISHGNALFNAESCRTTLGYREDDVGLVTLPLFHVTALNSQLVALLARGATVVLQKDYDTAGMLDLVSRHGVTALFLVPAVCKLIALRPDLDRYDFSRVRIAAYGGAPMDPETIRALRRILPAAMHNCYGLTECTSLGAVLPAPLALAAAGSVGYPVPGTEAQVRGASGEPLPPGEPGELFLKGPHVVRGYFGAPDKTRETFRDGWLRTGDIARVEEDGLVTILDRAKDMINRGGEKIYGLEVENVLHAFPGVAEAAVVGVHHPIFGEMPVAYVAPLPGAAPDPEGLREHCRSRLADYKVPAAVRLVERLPRNPGGKVLKGELKRAWEAGPREDAG